MIRLALTLALLAACWPNPHVVYVRVPVIVHQHDLALACANLPPFPGMTTVCHPGWVKAVSRWIDAAGGCLGVGTFDISWFLGDGTGCRD